MYGFNTIETLVNGSDIYNKMDESNQITRICQGI